MIDDNVEVAQIETIDLTGTLRAKLAPLSKIENSGTIANLVLCTRGNENLVMTPFADFEHGFTKLITRPDPDTRIALPWRSNTEAVISDLLQSDGTPCAFSPRDILRTAVARCSESGFKTKVGLEYEFCVFELDEFASADGNDRPVERGMNRNAYSYCRALDVLPVAEELFRRLDAAGALIETFHTEYSPGMYEVSFISQEALTAADNLVRARAYTKELLREFGLTTSPMVTVNGGENVTCTSVHNNVSLWKAGANAFLSGQTGKLSSVGQSFAAGLLATLQDCQVLFRPWVNSYRRFDPEALSPTHIAWGEDNHLVALRACYGDKPDEMTRLEHRVAGSDACPHLTLAAILHGGMHGIENSLALGEQTSTSGLEKAPRLHNSFPAATDAFRTSQFAREVFGSEFVDHYCQIRDEEWADYEAWCVDNDVVIDHNGPMVTDWERKHYFDWLQ